MKTLFKYATVVLLLAGTSACSQPSKRASIIDENIAVAEKQIGMLADSSETGGVIRIPSTWKNGRIDYVPVDDWVSGFFAGTLWYMYELTGDEAWAARARKHTEILDSVQYLQWHHDVGFMVYDSYGNGLRLLEHIKELRKRENVIIISARNSLEDKVLGLEQGADDYLPKPFHTAELLARIRSVLRRGRSGGDLSLSLGNVSLWPEGRRVEVEGRELALLKKEFDILLYFMQRPNHLVDKAVLAEAVWGDHADDADNFHFVYAQMKNLRRKLAEAGATVELKSVYGFGYKLSLPQSE